MGTAPAAAKKQTGISVLRCLNPGCRALLAYEVDATNALHVDLSWTALQDGDLRYFPCPKCRGKNILEAVASDDGKPVQRVTRWQP